MLELWHFDRNMEVSPEQVGLYSHRKVWWQHSCPTSGEEHEWQANVFAVYKTYMQDDRLRGGEYRIPCPICYKRARNKRLIEANRHTRKRLSAT